MADTAATSPAPAPVAPWHAGVTRYQWLVLAIASAGWVFDTFEGQIFNLTRGDLFNDLLKGHADLAPRNSFGVTVFSGSSCSAARWAASASACWRTAGAGGRRWL